MHKFIQRTFPITRRVTHNNSYIQTASLHGKSFLNGDPEETLTEAQLARLKRLEELNKILESKGYDFERDETGFFELWKLSRDPHFEEVCRIIDKEIYATISWRQLWSDLWNNK